jgi:hypothetical protein
MESARPPPPSPDYATLLAQYETVVQTNSELTAHLAASPSADSLFRLERENAELRSHLSSLADLQLSLHESEQECHRLKLVVMQSMEFKERLSQTRVKLQNCLSENDSLSAQLDTFSRRLALTRVPTAAAETQTELAVDELRRDNSHLRQANRELELQISGYEKTHRLTMTHIHSLEEENMKLRLAVDTSASRQDLISDMKILQSENSILHERLLASSHQMSQLLSRVDELQRKIHALSASESDVHRARAMGAFIDGMETVRRNALKRAAAVGEYEALRRRVAEAEKAVDDIAARLASAERERDEWRALASGLGDRIAAIGISR